MKKLKKKNGFTLIEMLVCTVTLLLIGMICTTGMNLAMMSLRSTSFEADSQMLESTLDLYISDILRHSVDITTEGTTVKFTNGAYYIKDGTLMVGTETGEITEKGYLVCTSKNNTVIKMVAGKGAYSDNLYIQNFTLNYDETTGIFTGGYQITSNSVDTVKNCTFSYRTIAEIVN